jgi:phosphatidylglycerophosphatase A
LIDRKKLVSDPRGLIAAGFGSGLAPIAPGTFGSIAALPLCYLLGLYLSWPVFLLVTVLVFGIGCWAASWVIRQFHIEDPGVIVIDEWVGMALTWLPAAYAPMIFSDMRHASWFYLIPALLIFRICDIAKPFPAGWVDDHLHGGFGAMLDDTIAGVWGAAIVCLLIYFLR